MFRLGLLAALLIAAVLPAEAGEKQLRMGDYYMISRGDNGKFLGSHKLFKQSGNGLYQVDYCGKTYWVRAKTVAWTQIEEEEHRRVVNIEYNRGRGWLPICSKPSQHVKLEDIGVAMAPHDMLYISDKEFSRANRFSAIAKSFGTGKNGPKGSYHSK